MKQALGWLAENLPASSALSFRPNMVFPRHRAVAVGVAGALRPRVSPLNISLTNGATAGMTIALMSVAPPGSTVATEAISHHTLVPLSTYLGFKLEGLAIDEDGHDARGAGRGLPQVRHPRRLRAALGDQPDRDADERGAARRRRRGCAQARHRHHRERRARPAGREPAAADRGTRAGAHALRHQLHQDHRAGPAHRLSRARPTAMSPRSPTGISSRTGWRRR